MLFADEPVGNGYDKTLRGELQGEFLHFRFGIGTVCLAYAGSDREFQGTRPDRMRGVLGGDVSPLAGIALVHGRVRDAGKTPRGENAGIVRAETGDVAQLVADLFRPDRGTGGGNGI